jgi:peptidase E
MNCVMGEADLVIDTCVNSPQIMGLGGFPSAEMLEVVLERARGRRVLYDGTASPQYGAPELAADVTTVSFYPWPPADLRELALSHDVILVGGGNTANMLAVWRAHGFDRILREAWESGVLLTGWSAGMICWFEAGVTDSFGPQLAGMRDGLGFLPGSACPHYDGEKDRRPTYQRLVRGGFPAGYAADDGAALHFVDTDLVACVASRATAGGYRVRAESDTITETPLSVRLLG